MAGEDLYAILGVLPDAEEVVIAAAYRALALRFHPDKWKGDIEEAHRRMCALNEAYEVLGDKARRAEYDKIRSRSNQSDFSADDNQDRSEAFDAAFHDMEDRWTVACSIYPDLKDHRAMLAKASSSLAFSYVTVLLETKAYARRAEMATHMEQLFLGRYFGSNSRVNDYARKLIRAGRKQAAKALNRLVVVMGSEVDPKLLIERINNDFGLREEQENLVKAAKCEELVSWVLYGHYEKALELANELGYKTRENYPRLFRPQEVIVKTPTNDSLKFENPTAFLMWAQETLCGTKIK